MLRRQRYVFQLLGFRVESEREREREREQEGGNPNSRISCFGYMCRILLDQIITQKSKFFLLDVVVYLVMLLISSLRELSLPYATYKELCERF